MSDNSTPAGGSPESLHHKMSSPEGQARLWASMYVHLVKAGQIKEEPPLSEEEAYQLVLQHLQQK